MAFVFGDSFDGAASNADLLASGNWTTGTIPTSASNTPFGTGRALAFSSQSLTSTNFGNQTTFWVSFWVRRTNTGAVAIQFRDGTSAQFTLAFALDLTVRTGTEAGSTIGTLVNAAPLNTFMHYVVRAVINNTTGSVTVYQNANSTPVLSLTSVNTRGGTSAAQINIIHVANVASSSGEIDDLLIWNESGAAPNAYIAQPRSLQLLPNADGSKTEFGTIVGSGSNWGANSESAPNGDASYVESSTVGETDLYNLDALPVTPSSIIGVQAYGWRRKTGAGARTYALRYKSGATEANALTNASLTTSYQRDAAFLATDPDTSSAWTSGGVNALQLGPRVEA